MAMTVQSMTGYSRVSRHGAAGTVTVELRSTNHRFLELSPRMPDGLTELEGQLTQLLRNSLHRGRIEMLVSYAPPTRGPRAVVIDLGLAQAYYNRLAELKRRFKLTGPLTLDHVLSKPAILTARDPHAVPPDAAPLARGAADAALQKLLAMRKEEGRRLVRDLRAQLAAIRRHAAAIRKQLPRTWKAQRLRFQQRLKDVFDGTTDLKSTHLQEAIALIKDVDIHEELTRLDSHLAHADNVLASGQPAGKKLDFLAQEFMREVNTIGSKANDAAITTRVIELKSAVEKIREQAQNLE